MLNYEKIHPTHTDRNKISRLYEQAFPKAEKISFESILTGHNLCLGFYDQQTFCGFVSLLSFKDIINIVYFAVEPALRSQGYGTQILSLLKKLYPDHRIYVDIEKNDPHAENNRQREQRKAFYLRNDFHLVDITYTWRTISYDVLVNQKTLTKQELIAFWHQFTQNVPAFL